MRIIPGEAEVTPVKKCVLILILLCLLPLNGLAEASLSAWANPEDPCYHLDPDCASAKGPLYALSPEAAEAFDRLPCPACASSQAPAAIAPEPEKDVDARITCVKRSGTWVFRVPQALLGSVEVSGGVAPEGTEALVNLLGEGLSDVMDATIAVPADGAPFLSARLIDGDAYVVMRPKHSYKAKRPFKWVAEHITLDIFNPGVFQITGISEVMRYTPGKQSHEPKRKWSGTFGEIDCDVYTGSDMIIAVLHWDHMTDKSALTGVVRIGDAGTDIPVSGYLSDGKAVYCCALSNAEYQALKDGAEPRIIPKADIGSFLAASDPAAEAASGEDGNPFLPAATLPPDIFAEASQG